MKTNSGKYFLAKIIPLFIKKESEISTDFLVKQTSYETCKATLLLERDDKEYEVKVTFRPMSSGDIQKFIEIIQRQPLLRNFLGLRNLNASVLQSLETFGVNLVPQTPQEFSMKSNLKIDKSLFYAVVSAIAEDLDKEPTLLFDLKAINQEDIINACNVQDVKAKIECINGQEKIPAIVLDKSNLDDMFELLPENPDFFPRKNFKIELLSIYEKIDEEFEGLAFNENIAPIRNTNYYFYKNEKGTLKAFVSPSNNFSFFLKSKGSLYRYKTEVRKIPVFVDGNLEWKQEAGLEVAVDIIFDYFLNLSKLGEDEMFTPSAKFLNYTSLLAKEMVKNLYFRPYVLENGDIFEIKYGFLNLNEHTQELIDAQRLLMPENFSFEGSNLYGKEFATEFLDYFVNYIVYKFIFIKGAAFKINPILNYLIKNQPFRMLKNEANVGKSLKIWFDSIATRRYRYRPLIRIEELSQSEFSVSVDIVDCKHPEVPIMDFSELFIETDDKKEIIKKEISDQIYLAGNYFEPLNRYAFSEGKMPIILSMGELLIVISQLSAILAKIDINILIPQTLKNIVIPKAVLRAHSKGEFNFQELFENKSIGTFTLDDMMDFSYEIALGDESISKEEFLELTKTAQKLIMYKDKYILLNPDDVKDLVKKLNSVDKIEMTNVKLLHGALTKQLNGFEFDYDEAFEKAIKNIINIEDIEIPESLTGTLRPYQVSGYKWLYSNCRKGFGSCIADDMGLGKTIQVLSLVLKLKEEGRLEKPVLCVVPTTLAGNWVKECQKFAPSIKTCIYHGLDRELDFSADMIITTYAILRMEIKELLDHEWSIVVIDEAQNIKNPTTAQTSAVKALKTPHCIAMTGTPIENRLSELWSIFDFANKGYLGSLGDFQKIYSNQIEKEKDIEAAQRLKRATSPFILRRLKTDKSIIDDLPEKMVLDDYCYLSKEQAALYEKTLENTMKSVQSSSGITRRGNILKLITSLKQICNHPAHYTKSKNFKIEESGKMGHTMELLRNIFMNDEKALIFSQYKEMGAILCKVINEEFNIDPIFFHGSLPRNKREEFIEDFQTNEDKKLMILSLKAGGTGLNLTAASNVIHYDLWWNPAVENQATDRTYRIGQDKNIMVHRLITMGTFEEKIDDMLKAKMELVNMSLFSGEQNITELSDKEILEIFSLTV
ncbi:MAG: SNF2-related protein [bacterium]